LAETERRSSMRDTQSERPLAAVTGALSGIGYELVRQFAQNGYDLIAVDEEDEIASLADAVAEYGCELTPLQLDLSTLEGQRAFVRAVKSEFRPLDAIAINAGVSVCGEFARETSLEEELNLIDLDILGTVRITKALLPDMLKRRKGRVLLTSATAALKPTPYEAVHAASKAFLLSFASSLQGELKNTGVSVTALIPGNTFSEDKPDPALCARVGFRALMKGEERAVTTGLELAASSAA
jgi:uncharacterized protein